MIFQSKVFSTKIFNQCQNTKESPIKEMGELVETKELMNKQFHFGGGVRMIRKKGKLPNGRTF